MQLSRHLPINHTEFKQFYAVAMILNHLIFVISFILGTTIHAGNLAIALLNSKTNLVHSLMMLPCWKLGPEIKCLWILTARDSNTLFGHFVSIFTCYS